jgi:hypothetical protein
MAESPLARLLRRFQFMSQEKATGRWGTLPGDTLAEAFQKSQKARGGTWTETEREYQTVRYTDPTTGAVLEYRRTTKSTFELAGSDDETTMTLEFLDPTPGEDAEIVDSGTIS